MPHMIHLWKKKVAQGHITAPICCLYINFDEIKAKDILNKLKSKTTMCAYKKDQNDFNYFCDERSFYWRHYKKYQRYK